MKKRRPVYDFFAPSSQIDVRLCEREGCKEKAEFRAPKSPHLLREYYWFCLNHVRDYNKAWDFYQGMSTDEINASRVSDVTWNRPSWPLGSWRVLLEAIPWPDELEFMAEKTASLPPSLPQDVQKALKTLEVGFPFTLESLKTQYKKLVKCHHPDLHAGDKGAEEKIKRINTAYHRLKTYLEDAPENKNSK